jgi:predicted RND superfamily exporter protein
MIDRYIAFVLRRRWLVLTLALAVTVAAGVGLGRLELSSDYRDFFAKDNPELIAFQDLEHRYAKNNNIFIAVTAEGGSILTRESLTTVHRLTSEAWRLPHVTRVDSLTNFEHIAGENDDVVIRELVRDPADLDAAELARIETIVRGEPLIQDHLVSRALDVAGVNITVDSAGLTDVEKPRLMGMLTDLLADLEQANPGLDFHVTGSVAVDRAFDIAAERDFGVLIPIMYLVLLIVAFLVMRSIAATLGTFLVFTFATVTALGVIGFLGVKVTAISVAAPTIIMCLAVCHCMHVAMNAMQDMRQTGDIRTGIAQSLRQNFGALFLTSLTTIVGFVTMTMSGEVPPLADLGLTLSIGMTSAYLLSISFFPAFLATFVRRVPLDRGETRLAAGLSRALTAKPVVVAAVFGAFAILCTAFIGKNEINDNYIEYFGKGVPIRRDTEHVAARLTGVHQIYYSVPSGRPGGIFEPSYLTTLDGFVAWLRTRSEVRHVTALTDTLARIHREMHSGDPAYHRIASTREENAQYFLLYEMSQPYGMDVTDRVDREQSATRVAVTLDNVSSREILALDRAAQEWLATHATPAMAATRGSGPTMMFAHIGQRNARSLIVGNIASWGFVFLIFLLAFRSVKLAVIGMIPNTLPAFMAFGIWGLIDGTVGLAISIVTVMTFGIIEDDTVHAMTKYLQARRHGDNVRDALTHSLNRAGTAIVGASVVLGLGFAVLAFSDFRLNAGLGILTAIVIFAALLADLLLLPGLLSLFDRRDPAAARPKERSVTRLVKKAAVVCLTLAAAHRLAIAGDKTGATAASETAGAAATGGRKVALAVDQANAGFHAEIGQVDLEIIDSDGGTVTRKLALRTREGEDAGDKSLITFSAPADVKGTRFLTWNHGDREDDQWLYLPALKRVKRISGANKTGSFMGSEFSYEDVANPEVDEFRYELLDETTFSGKEAWVYARFPRDERSGSPRQVLTVLKELMFPVKIEYYNRRDELAKVALYAGFKKYGRYYRPTVIEMTNVRTQRRSVLRWRSLELGGDVAVTDSELRPDTLAQ